MIDPRLIAAIGPRVRVSPFFEATVRSGLAAVSTYNHMWLPMGYGDPEAEYQRLTTGVSMWDVAAQRHIEVRGENADALVQLVTAVDVSDLAPGHAMWAPMVDHAGTLVNDPVLLHWPDGSWRLSISDSDVRLWIDAIGRGHGVEAQVRELDTATLAIQGPESGVVVRELDVGWATTLDRFEMRPATIDGIDLVLSRSGWSNQGGYELFLDAPEHAERLWEVVAAAGAGAGIGPGCPNPMERLENVLLSYGTDTGYDADPLELGLADAIDIDGPAFIGQEALRRIRDAGPRRRLLGAVLDGDAIDTLPYPAPLTVDDRVVGRLRAANHSPRFGVNLGLVLVDSAVEAGSTGTVEIPEGLRHAELVDLPFTESVGAD